MAGWRPVLAGRIPVGGLLLCWLGGRLAGIGRGLGRVSGRGLGLSVAPSVLEDVVGAALLAPTREECVRLPHRAQPAGEAAGLRLALKPPVMADPLAGHLRQGDEGARPP